MAKLSVIIPCYNNELNIPVTTAELILNEQQFSGPMQFEYVMVNDGSKDQTLAELKKFKAGFPDKVKVINLSGNFGSYNAILAGMQYATGDCNVVITADLQDPPQLMTQMVDYWEKGFKLVLANREQREDGASSFFAKWYQRMIKKYALPELPAGGFDFCLFDKQLRDQVVEMRENNTNSLYLLVWMKYPYACIPYTRKKREIGKSQWTLKKKIKLFIDSFVSFSYLPLRLITISGLMLGLIAGIYGVYVLIAKISGLIDVEGWTTLMLVFLFVSAFQMTAIGIIGEYLWRTLEAGRKRPAFIVDEII